MRSSISLSQPTDIMSSGSSSNAFGDEHNAFADEQEYEVSDNSFPALTSDAKRTTPWDIYSTIEGRVFKKTDDEKYPTTLDVLEQYFDHIRLPKEEEGDGEKLEDDAKSDLESLTSGSDYFSANSSELGSSKSSATKFHRDTPAKKVLVLKSWHAPEEATNEVSKSKSKRTTSSSKSSGSRSWRAPEEGTSEVRKSKSKRTTSRSKSSSSRSWRAPQEAAVETIPTIAYQYRATMGNKTLISKGYRAPEAAAVEADKSIETSKLNETSKLVEVSKPVETKAKTSWASLLR